MRELCWSLWKQRWAFLVFAVTVPAAREGFGLFEMGYRTAYVLLQTVFMIMQRERFLVVLRKERAHRFYRSMPHAWDKEQCRFLWIDALCGAILMVFLTVGIVFRKEFTDVGTPFALVVFFLVYMMVSRIMACVPYVWWVSEIVFAVVFLLVPAFGITALFCGGTAVIGGVVLVLLYGFIRKLWKMED